MNCSNHVKEEADHKASSGLENTLSGDKDFTPVDLVIKQFRTQVGHLTYAIMEATRSYIDARMCREASSKLGSVYDNNFPGWRNDPRAQELLQRMTDLEALEDQLKQTKEYIRATKTILLTLYEEIFAFYRYTKVSIHANKDSEKYPDLVIAKEKCDDMMKEVNNKMVHVMAAMELILQTDQGDAYNLQTS